MRFVRFTLNWVAALLVALVAIPSSAVALDVPVQQLRIHTVLDETGEPFTDACYELTDYSTTPACDDDSDGVVQFDYVPVGTYSLIQTADLGGLYPIGEPGVYLHQIEVRDEDNNDYHVRLIEAGQDTDLGLITRDPETGNLLKGACYELVEYSNIGCDDDGNGIIMFDAIPWGTYTVHQTETPEGYDPMGDYEIHLSPFPNGGKGPVIIPLLQAETQGSETATNMSVLIVDVDTEDRVANAENCIQFPGMTNTGCDDDVVDGQIDFLGVDPTSGQPTFEAESLACGLERANPGEVHMHRVGEFHISLVMTVRVIPADCPA